MKDIVKQIRNAEKKEYNDNHLSDDEREKLVKDVESLVSRDYLSMIEYPFKESITDRYIFIIYNM